MAKEKRYWDSSVIIAYLNNERDRADSVKNILDEAEDGNIEIYTSALTIAEVLRYKGKKPIDKTKRERVREFFENDYFTIVSVTREVAFRAQEVVWDHGVPPKDSIHVASALFSRLSIFESYDISHLVSNSGKIGNPPLEIREPVPFIAQGQRTLQLSSVDDEEEEEK